MSSVLANLEANAPMGKAKTTDEKIKAIEDYLVQLLEQFRWTLNNLSADNFNEKEVVSWLNKEITEPIRVAIQSAEEDMRTEIQASAEGVELNIHREYAVAWVSGTAYKVGDVIKRESTNIDGTVNVGFYRCTQDHTAADNNRPPTGAYWSSYWSVTQATDVLHTRFDVNASEIRSEVARATGAEGDLSSAITQSANNIRLEVKGDYAKEWTSGTAYYKSDVVKVTTTVNGVVTAVNFYKAKQNHTAAAGNKPPNGTYWESVSNTTVQSMIDMNLNGITLSYDNSQVGSGDNNASYIKLTKDGTEIAGGKVKVTNLDASTITAGSLSADNVKLLDEFDVYCTGFDDSPHLCGKIGGYLSGSANNPHYTLLLETGTSGTGGSIFIEPSNIEIEVSKWDSVNARTDSVLMQITHTGVVLERHLNGVTKTIDLFNL